MRAFKIISCSMALAALAGCGALKNFDWSFQPEDSSTVFAKHVRGPVSVAWRNVRGEIWLVPKRGVLIEQISAGGAPASWSAYGAYVVIRGNPRQISMFVDGRWWAMPVSWDEAG